MGKKVALLVGVSNYHQQGLSALPSATKDARAMKQVLQHPDIGGFAETDITLLLNPTKDTMADAIDNLFANRSSEDLVLFYFSGHGVKDEKGNLYIATPTTRTDQNKRVRPFTAIPASFVKDQMTDSSSRRQIVILDCCFSGAFARGLTLGNKSWAVLTSSDTVEYSYTGEPSQLSIYTRYLVEGIKTGVGDSNNDGNISVDELYEYTKKKVQEASRDMNPLFDHGREGHKIVVAKSPQHDPKLIYRKLVGRYAREEKQKSTSLNYVFEGNITDSFKRDSLKDFQKSLNLTPEEAKTIEDEVLKPHRQRKENFKKYENLFVKALKQGYPVSKENRRTLKDYQGLLNLSDEDIEQIEKRILDSLAIPPPTPKPPKVPSGGSDNLDSEKGINYTKLRDLLVAKQWKEADEETAKVMLKAAEKEFLGYLHEDDIKNFPVTDLRTINQLWVKYSGGRFGFSVQKPIYLQVSKNYDQLGDRLGWKKGGQWLYWRSLNFSEQAPKGHLPSGTCPLGKVEGLIWDGCNVVSTLLVRSEL
ncbi:MAG: GUN4 domain-containing protein [Brasilonema octagenarum HA4186-MV1]|jgi:CRISPR/Cas system CSM-associated protein Csm2 small subunit|nr:GUN4 domain-containing protein [Brasilonema octagenarum HA4186-MV1]